MTRREALALLTALPVPCVGPSWRANRRYTNVTPKSIARCRATHVRVTGTVTLVRKEADGDLHFRVSDDTGNFVVCEIMPYLPLPRPQLGEVVTVEGIRRYDDDGGHGWWELHPVENWSGN